MTYTFGRGILNEDVLMPRLVDEKRLQVIKQYK